MSIQTLREQRTAAAQKLRAHWDANEKTAWGAEQQDVYNTLAAEIDAIDAKIGAHDDLMKREATNAAEIRRIADGRGISDDYAHEVQAAEKSLITAWMRGGPSALGEEQLRIQSSRFAEIRNTMSTGTGSEGGYTVQTEMARSISEAMKAYGGMREVAEVFRTATGAALSYPTSDGTSELGELIAENGSATAADPTFGTVSLSTYKFGSKIIAVPFELLQDSAFDLEAFVRQRIEQRLGRITNQMATTGTGTGQPRGVVTAAVSGKVGATGQTVTATFDDLIDLEHSVDPAYRAMGRCAYMFNDSTLRALKKIKDSQNRPLWLPGYDVQAPDMINGRPYVINQDMAAMAANAKSILFGDFSNYKIRDVMAMLMFRFTDSVYASKGQVGFLAWMRSGGNLVDVGGAVKFYQNSAT